ncbi:MAG: diguanylate cyclase [Kineosporiaceae bacterium]
MAQVMQGRSVAGTSSGDTETVPLSQRVWAMAVFRTAVTAALLGVSALAGDADLGAQVPFAVAYLVFTSLLSLLVLTPRRELALAGFGFALLLDGVFLQYQRHRLAAGLAVDVAVAAFLVAVCLLASFRTGLKVAVWQSLLLLLEFRSIESGLIKPGPAPLDDESFLAHLGLFWLVVLATSSAAAISERELRHRRYDAEELQRFAVALHEAQRPEEVALRLLHFAVHELDAVRALIVRRSAIGLELVVGHQVYRVPAGVEPVSALLQIPSRPDQPVLAMRLDPDRDPWLTTAIPQARRLVALRLDSGETTPTFLVMEHGRQRGRRVERRLVTSAGQAAATTSLALSRAELLENARIAASHDGLTGVLNRRSFDDELDRLQRLHHSSGTPFALIMVDVDKFKSVNDTYGHQMGDRVLQVVARTLVAGGAEQAMTARYGGEEFAVLLPGLNAAQAFEVADTMRVMLHSVEGVVPVTASFGVASMPEDTLVAEELVELADGALMRAKQTGRDKVVLAAGMKQGLKVAPIRTAG